MDEPEIYFDSPLNQSSYIKVIGVGGGGGNAVNHMFNRGISGVDFIVANTDMKALAASPVPAKLVLGRDGLGVGGKPQKGRRAAEAKADEIKDLFAQNTKMIFITAGMGGGTGTGAAPVIARIAKEIKLEDCDEDDPDKILVVAVVTTPFEMEGSRRFQQAIEGIEELKKYTDSILIINNEKLRAYGNLGFTDAFSMANDVLLTAVKGIAEIITLNAYVNIDFCDVNTVMSNSGTALMGVGEGEGENRAMQAIEQATTSVLLNDNDIAGAKDVLLYISWSSDSEITMDEMSTITEYLKEKTGGPDTNVIWGAGTDDTLGSKVKITLIATGFEQREPLVPTTHILPPDEPKDTKPSDKPKTDPFIRPADSTAPRLTDNPFVPKAEVKVEDTAAAHAQVPQAPAAPVDETPKPRVIMLEDVAPTTPTAVQPEAKKVEDEVRILTRPAQSDPVETRSEPVYATPRSEPRRIVQPETVAMPTSQSMGGMVSDRSERIRHIHNLLRHQENGATIVEQMDAVKVMGDSVYQTQSSSESETANSVSSNGEVSSVLPIFHLPD